MVEQGTENPRVGSSILSLGTRESKGLQQKLQAFFRYGLLPVGRLRADDRPSPPPVRASPCYPLSFPVLLFPCLCPGSWGFPDFAAGFPRTTYRPSSVRQRPGATLRVPHIWMIMSILLRRCLLSQPSRKCLRAESGKETSASFPLPVVPYAGMFVMVRPAEGRNQAKGMPSPPKTRTVSSSCQRCSRSRTALGP